MSNSQDSNDVYEPNWGSLKQYSVPEWFMDAKLGIFIHWGAYAVPAFEGEWYPRNMYIRDNPAFEHHREQWGPQGEFGYKDFIPMLTAEHWEPDDWAELFEKAGARYVVPVAEHHDGFAMYDSDYTQWHSVNMGPKRDIVGELAGPVRRRGMRFGVSSHRAFNWRYYTYEPEFDTTDPENAGLYCPEHGEDEPASEDFLKNWFGRVKELVDKYQPAILWFDFGWHEDEFAPYRPQVAAYYYNAAKNWDVGPVLQYKDKFPDGTAVLDVERGKLVDIRDDYWQTDTSVSYKSWGYIENDELKPLKIIIDDLVDIVSKNGNLLLNIGPKPDGTIPHGQRDLLIGLGQWLQIHGEAIYDTRPWSTFGEGPTEVMGGHATERDNEPLTEEDLRFTTKGRDIYAFCMGWPEGTVSIRSMDSYSTVTADEIEDITVVGHGESLEWLQDRQGLHITPPLEFPSEYAICFKIDRSTGM